MTTLTKAKRYITPGKIFVFALWAMIAVFVFLNKDKLTVKTITNYAPGNAQAAIMLLMALFALKGMVMVLNADIFYIASGIMFTLPGAIAVNAVGSLIMIMIPYVIGRRGGDEVLDRLVYKHKKLAFLKEAPRKNDILMCFLLRVVGVLPCEPISIYLGACGLSPVRYIIGSMLGLAPSLILFAFIGEYAAKPDSPQFRIAVCILTAVMLTSILYSVFGKILSKINNK